jgi:hypothetical protein
MKHPIRILALLAVAAASSSALAAGENPNARAPNSSFYYDSLQGMPRSAATPSFGGPNPLAQNAMRRPTMRLGPITPVPEPSTWALMVAGFSVLGFIVRRGGRR